MSVEEYKISDTPPMEKGVSLSPEISESDRETWEQITYRILTLEQLVRVSKPQQVYPGQGNVLAVHWHPEFVPLDNIRQRIENTFPHRSRWLIIPTQHNILTSYDEFSGVEVDCYARGFNRKIQFLVHFENSRLAKADVFRGMLEHTFKYRTSQLNEYIDSILQSSYEHRVGQAAGRTGADRELIDFVRGYAAKLKRLMEENADRTPVIAYRNKLVRDYFDTLRSSHDEDIVNRAQVFLKALNEIVKREFTLDFYFDAEEIIEEVRGLGGGIVIPHPEQFWPVLMANYDVDGIEVWNPKSREYTEFLIDIVHRQNNSACRRARPLLIFMGDDTHMGEKVKEYSRQDPLSALREIGVQPAWDDPPIRKCLQTASASREIVIEEYRARLME